MYRVSSLSANSFTNENMILNYKNTCKNEARLN